MTVFYDLLEHCVLAMSRAPGLRPVQYELVDADLGESPDHVVADPTDSQA